MRDCFAALAKKAKRLFQQPVIASSEKEYFCFIKFSWIFGCGWMIKTIVQPPVNSKPKLYVWDKQGKMKAILQKTALMRIVIF